MRGYVVSLEIGSDLTCSDLKNAGGFLNPVLPRSAYGLKLLPPQQKILIVTDAWKPQVNGVVTTISNIRKQLKQLGHRVYLIKPESFNSVPSLYPDVRLAIPIGIERYITEVKPDKILIMTEGPLGWAIRYFCLKHKLPFTTCYTTRWPEYFETLYKFPPKAWGYQYMRTFHEPAASILVATPSLLAELQQKGFHNLVLWNRGVDLNRFKPIAPEEKMAFFPDLPRPFYLYVGRISKEKNLEAFLECDLPGTKILIGQGPDFNELKQKYKQAVFTGPKYSEDLAKTYASCDVMVFPSLTDTFGLVMLEALASGLPVVAFDVTGPKDVIQSGCKVGFLAKYQSELSALAIDAYVKVQSGGITAERCRQYAQQFSWANVAQAILDSASSLSLNSLSLKN